jgi:hypothetical protein
MMQLPMVTVQHTIMADVQPQHTASMLQHLLNLPAGVRSRYCHLLMSHATAQLKTPPQASVPQKKTHKPHCP